MIDVHIVRDKWLVTYSIHGNNYARWFNKKWKANQEARRFRKLGYENVKVEKIG